MWVHSTNFDKRVARLFQRASQDFGVMTYLGPPANCSATYPGLVGLYYPDQAESDKADALDQEINNRFYEYQRNPMQGASSLKNWITRKIYA